MQDGVLNAADVLVNGQPILGAFVYHASGATGTGVARVIPGRFDESVHSVGLTLCRAATLRASGLIKLRHLRQWRACAGDRYVLRQYNR